MSDEYQLRKDIDDLYHRIFDIGSGELLLASKDELDKVVEKLKGDNSLEVLETNLSTFSNDLDEYVESLESFETQLNGYGDSLESFEGDLSDYGDSLDGFSTQLTGYGGQLSGFSTQLTNYRNQLSGFGTTLNGYGSRLDDFDDILNDESDGFITALSTLKTYIYGYDPNNPNAHTYNNPTSDSLKGMTNSLQQLIQDLQTGDGIVLENLGRLKSHIQAFSGSLQEFKTYLAQQGVNVSTLNDDVISLILELNKSLDTISEHQDMLEEAQEIIGEPSTQSTEATGMFKRLEDGEAIMESVSDKADDLDVVINGDPNVQGDTGLVGATSDLQNSVGDANSGLIKDTNALKTTVGNSSSGLVKETNALKTTVGNSSSGLVKDTNALKTTVGNSNSGLVKQTNDLQNTVGDNNSGLVAQTNELIDTIGEPSVGQQSATGLHLLIDNAQETANAVEGVTDNIKLKIGYSAIGDTNLQTQITTQGNKIGNVPSGQTLQGQITAHDGKIGNVPSGNDLYSLFNGLNTEYLQTKSAVSDISTTQLPSLEGELDTLGEFLTSLSYALLQILKPSEDYTEIYYCMGGTPDSQELRIWEIDYGYDTSNIQYAVNSTGSTFVKSGDNWVTGIIPSSITKKIGLVSYFNERPHDAFNPTFDYIYSVPQREYYKLVPP